MICHCTLREFQYVSFKADSEYTAKSSSLDIFLIFVLNKINLLAQDMNSYF